MQAFLAALQAETDNHLLRVITLYEEALLEPQAPLVAFFTLPVDSYQISKSHGAPTFYWREEKNHLKQMSLFKL
jgi:hypothetical protein